MLQRLAIDVLQGRVKWVGDTPAAWHHYFEPLAPFIEPVSMARGQHMSSIRCQLQPATACAPRLPLAVGL